MNILAELKGRLRSALEGLVAQSDRRDELAEMLRPAQDARFGDYQANCAMPLGKLLGQPPPEIARQLRARLAVDDLCHSVEIAGPGFLNFRLRDEWLAAQLQRACPDPRLGLEPVRRPRTYVVDYSSPNVAKPMHVGHIRSTVIGDALVRMLRFLGHRVISDNHLGDWGTQFGMILYGYRRFGDPSRYAAQPLEELGRVYQLVRRLIDVQEAHRRWPELEERLARHQELAAAEQPAAEAGDKKAAKALRKLQAHGQQLRDELDSLQNLISGVETDAELRSLAQAHPELEQAVLQETALLHAGDADRRQLWQRFLRECRQEIQHIYDRLGVSFDVELGESYYHDRLEAVVQELVQRGLARESAGAICLFLDGFDAPMIVRKKDGAFLYATTDLATIQYRLERWQPDVILYVVDFRQGEHFQKLFAAARRWLDTPVELVHVSFGTVLGEDGRPFKTRAGDTVGLEGLLDEAVRRAEQVLRENDESKPAGPELSADERRQIAQVVGHAAIKYADLSQNRTSDYLFSYDKMVAMQGNTATYLQYSYARIQNIFARSGCDVQALRQSAATIRLEHPAERALALVLLQLAESLEESLVDYRPNLLTNYLFDLAKKFSDFYEACPVLRAADAAQRDSRLLLCDMAGRTLKLGLELLGIQVVDRM